MTNPWRERHRPAGKGPLALSGMRPVRGQVHQVIEDVDRGGGQRERDKGQHPGPDHKGRKVMRCQNGQEDQHVLQPLMRPDRLEIGLPATPGGGRDHLGPVWCSLHDPVKKTQVTRYRLRHVPLAHQHRLAPARPGGAERIQNRFVIRQRRRIHRDPVNTRLKPARKPCHQNAQCSPGRHAHQRHGAFIGQVCAHQPAVERHGQGCRGKGDCILHGPCNSSKCPRPASPRRRIHIPDRPLRRDSCFSRHMPKFSPVPRVDGPYSAECICKG